MFKPLVRATLVAALLVFVAACQKQAENGAVSTPASAAAPDAAILASINLLKQGDIGGLMQNALPPAEFAKAKADWGKDKNEQPITDEDRAKFNEAMTKLTAPDAEQKLFAEIEPKLKEFDAQYQQQIPMYATMGSTVVKNMIQQNQSLSEAERGQAVAAVDALVAWVQKTRFTDPESELDVPAAAADVRVAYRTTVDQVIQEWKDALGAIGAGYELVLTDQPYAVPLRHAFGARERRA